MLHTVTTTANFYEAYELKKCLQGKAKKSSISARHECYRQLINLVENERQNTIAAMDVLARDIRLDLYYHPFLAVAHLKDMIETKLQLLEQERSVYLPRLEQQLLRP